MHRVILGVEDRRTVVDHKNRDTMDNRRENIRACSHAENMMNRKTARHNCSGLKGAHQSSGRGWKSEIRAHGKRIQLGVFKTPEAAHEAYVAAAKKYHGEFARAG